MPRQELGPIPHGTPTGYYSRKCPCDECRAAMRQYKADRKKKAVKLTAEDYKKKAASVRESRIKKITAELKSEHENPRKARPAKKQLETIATHGLGGIKPWR